MSIFELQRNLYLKTKNNAFIGESLLSMPSLAVCYTETCPIPHFRDLHYDRNGAITFGYTNNTLKHTISLVELWVRILEKLPSASLIVMGVNHVATENKIRGILKNVAGNEHRVPFSRRAHLWSSWGKSDFAGDILDLKNTGLSRLDL